MINELYEVKDQLDFAWSEKNYIYWTDEEYKSGSRDKIGMFNMSNGLAPQYYVDRIGDYGWSARCVREKK